MKQILDFFATFVAGQKPWKSAAKENVQDWPLQAARSTDNADNLVMFLSHRNGFVREAAAIRCGECLFPQTLGPLVERINDWVPEVRAAAIAAVAKFVTGDRLEDIVRVLPSVGRLRQQSRSDHREFVDMIEQWVVEHPRRPKLSDLIGQCESGIVRSLFALELSKPTRDIGVLINVGLRSRDRVVSSAACKLVGSLHVDDRIVLARRLLGMRQAQFKLAGLKYLRALDHDDAAAEARTFLLSSNTALRELSEQIANLEAEGLANIVSRALSNESMAPKQRIVAATLCGNRRISGCRTQLQELLGHSNAGLRGAALLALYRLEPDTYEQPIKIALHDPETSVRRAAIRAACEGQIALTVEEWREILQSASTRGSASALLGLARKLGKWHWLGVALELTLRDQFADVGTSGVENWLAVVNRSFRQPSVADRRWITDLIGRSHMKAARLDLLRFHLG